MSNQLNLDDLNAAIEQLSTDRRDLFAKLIKVLNEESSKKILEYGIPNRIYLGTGMAAYTPIFQNFAEVYVSDLLGQNQVILDWSDDLFPKTDLQYKEPIGWEIDRLNYFTVPYIKPSK